MTPLRNERSWITSLKSGGKACSIVACRIFSGSRGKDDAPFEELLRDHNCNSVRTRCYEHRGVVSWLFEPPNFNHLLQHLKIQS